MHGIECAVRAGSMLVHDGSTAGTLRVDSVVQPL